MCPALCALCASGGLHSAPCEADHTRLACVTCSCGGSPCTITAHTKGSVREPNVYAYACAHCITGHTERPTPPSVAVRLVYRCVGCTTRRGPPRAGCCGSVSKTSSSCSRRSSCSAVVPLAPSVCQRCALAHDQTRCHPQRRSLWLMISQPGTRSARGRSCAVTVWVRC